VQWNRSPWLAAAEVFLGFCRIRSWSAPTVLGAQALQRAARRPEISPGVTADQATSMLRAAVPGLKAQKGFAAGDQVCRSAPKRGPRPPAATPAPVCRPLGFTVRPSAKPLAPTGPNCSLPYCHRREPACWVSAWALIFPAPRSRNSGSLGFPKHRQISKGACVFLGLSPDDISSQFHRRDPCHLPDRRGSAQRRGLGKPDALLDASLVVRRACRTRSRRTPCGCVRWIDTARRRKPLHEHQMAGARD